MDLLNSRKLDDNNQLVGMSCAASFSQQSGNFKEPNSDWLILNYLDNLLKVEAYFQEKFTNVVAIMRNYLFGSVVTKIN